MDVEETEARNECASEGQQQFNRQTHEASESREIGRGSSRFQALKPSVWDRPRLRHTPLAEAWEAESPVVLSRRVSTPG
jgi:hypothetical protein